MRIYDISLEITPDLPVWPGDPGVVMVQESKIEEGAESNVTRLNMGVHTGTHIDAPLHFLPGGAPMDELPLKTLTGRVYVLHLPDVDLVTADVLKRSEIPPRTRRIILKTRNSDYWRDQVAGFQTDFVGVSADGAQYLVDRGVKLIGVDYLSVAPYSDGVTPHRILLKAGVVIVEGLNLTEVSQGRYTLYCLPLRLAGVEGAPARAILIGV